MRTVFAPYRPGVSATRELAAKFASFCIRPEGSKFRPRVDDLIVNWGRSNLPDFPVGRVLNHPDAVAVCVDKLKTFHAFTEHNVPTVEWTQSPAVADGWCQAGAVAVAGLARVSLHGRGGVGIVPFYHGTEYGPEGDVFPDAPLYTRYHKRKAEFRVHVLDGKVISLQQKKLRDGTEKHDLTFIIRNYANGWIFARNDIEVPECVKNAAIAAVRALGLDFGGVDVGWNQSQDRAYVYEVNSAPGIEGTTLEDYANALRTI